MSKCWQCFVMCLEEVSHLLNTFDIYGCRICLLYDTITVVFWNVCSFLHTTIVSWCDFEHMA